MHILELLTRFRLIWEKLAPILGLLFFIFKVLNYLGRKRMDARPPANWRPRRNPVRRPSGRWSPPGRTRFGKRWSVNDIPRP